MYSKILRFISPAALIALAACGSQQGYYEPAYVTAPQPYTEQQSYVQQTAGNPSPIIPQGQKIRFKAEDIKFISSYNAPNRNPNVDHLLIVYPEQIIHKWAVNRFGVNKETTDHVRFLIKDASIVEKNIVTGGSMNKSVKQQYSGKFEVLIQIVNEENGLKSEATASVMRDVIVNKEATLEEREQVWTILTFDLIKELSSKLDYELSQASYNEFVMR